MTRMAHRDPAIWRVWRVWRISPDHYGSLRITTDHYGSEGWGFESLRARELVEGIVPLQRASPCRRDFFDVEQL